MNEDDFLEKRRFVRFDIKTQVNFRVKDNARAQLYLGKIWAITRNLCVEGVCFATDQKLEEKTLLGLEIFLPSQSKPLHLEGMVKWALPFKQKNNKQMYNIGVQLVSIDKSDENRFVGYISDKLVRHSSKYLNP